MTATPIARGPLTDWSRRAGATFEVRDGWEVAASLPAGSPGSAANILVDRSHLATFEINGPKTGAAVTSLCGTDLGVRRIQSDADRDIYRLTPTRAIVFSLASLSADRSGDAEMLDVTGGWATLSLIGPDAERILSKVTAVDLRDRTLPVGGCCQGPIFGVNTLFGRFDDRFDLHVCTDSAEFFWEVLLDAGAEFGLRAAGEGAR